MGRLAVLRQAQQIGFARSEVTTEPAPPALFDLPPAVDEIADAFGGWSRLRVSTTGHLDSWTTTHLGQLKALAEAARPALIGTSLVHLDVRADNALIDVVPHDAREICSARCARLAMPIGSRSGG